MTRLGDTSTILDGDRSTLVSDALSTSEEVACRLVAAGWIGGDSPGCRAVRLLDERRIRAWQWLEDRVDVDGRMETDDVLEALLMVGRDAGEVAVWMHAAGARAGGREAARQVSEHREAGRDPTVVLLTEPPAMRTDEYADGDPRRGSPHA